MKSKLDIFVERRILIEKESIASKVISAYNNNQPGRIAFITELDSNKIAAFSYIDEKEMYVYLMVILKNVYLNINLSSEVQKAINDMKNRLPNEIPKWFIPYGVENFMDDYTLFTYGLRTGGTNVLAQVINDTIANVLTLESLRIEKILLDYGR